MSKKDWFLLQQYMSIRLMPVEMYRAVCSLALFIQSAMCDNTKNCADCPGKENCPIGSVLYRAVIDDQRRAKANGCTIDSPCDVLAINYYEVVLHYFWYVEGKKMDEGGIYGK